MPPIKDIPMLPIDFVPGPNDILIGRGKKCYDHPGNQWLRNIVKSRLTEYSEATCKFHKSIILGSIVEQIQQKGKFVKLDPETGRRWLDVGNLLALKKVAQTFRDSLHGQYKSSYMFKNKRRSQASTIPPKKTHKTVKDKVSPLNVFSKAEEQQPPIRRKSNGFQESILGKKTNDALEIMKSSLPLEDDDNNPFEPIPVSNVFDTRPIVSESSIVDPFEFDRIYWDPFTFLQEDPFVETNCKMPTSYRKESCSSFLRKT